MSDRLSSFGADSSEIQYTDGNWTRIDSGTYLSRDLNATVTFDFNGTLIAVAGTIQSQLPVQDSHSPLSYVLDGEDDLSFLFNASLPNIYASPELLQGPHTLAIRLLTANTTLSVSGGNITTWQPESASPNHHRTIAIIAGTVGGLVVLVVMLLALLLFRRRQRHYPSTPYALGPLQANLPSTKEAFTSPKYSNHGLSFTQSTDSVNVLPRVKAPPPPLPGPGKTPVKAPRPKPSAQ
ncbi:hypothetical protein DFH07DRAFT_1068251 [Mycena maculata]|uniref:Uncharacterized protein n=1 Tax=Mycena maculata TaxID=230809 RepID=A0AAD7MI30_9AGAR|nr:hypothetical protein DFH07DRAFT_1068251 [Mycena maculata]